MEGLEVFCLFRFRGSAEVDFRLEADGLKRPKRAKVTSAIELDHFNYLSRGVSGCQPAITRAPVIWSSVPAVAGGRYLLSSHPPNIATVEM